MKIVAKIKRELILYNGKIYYREEWPSGLVVWNYYVEHFDKVNDFCLLRELDYSYGNIESEEDNGN